MTETPKPEQEADQTTGTAQPITKVKELAELLNLLEKIKVTAIDACTAVAAIGEMQVPAAVLDSRNASEIPLKTWDEIIGATQAWVEAAKLERSIGQFPAATTTNALISDLKILVGRQ